MNLNDSIKKQQEIFKARFVSIFDDAVTPEGIDDFLSSAIRETVREVLEEVNGNIGLKLDEYMNDGDENAAMGLSRARRIIDSILTA